MGKRGIFSHIESSAISNLQALKNELFLKEGSIHTLKLTEEDGIVIPEKEKEQGFHTKHVVIIGHNENEYYGCVLIQSTPNRNIHSLETIKKDFHPIAKKDYPFIKTSCDPSYVDGGQIFTFSKDRITAGNNCRGILTESDLNAVISKVKNSERIEPADLVEYGLLEGC